MLEETTLLDDVRTPATTFTPEHRKALSDSMRRRCNSIAFMQDTYLERHHVPVTLPSSPYLKSIGATGDKGAQ